MAELSSDGLQHFPDGQIIGTARLTHTAANAVRGFGVLRDIALLCPVGEAIASQIAMEDKHIGDADANSARGTVVTAAAEIGTQEVADFLDLRLLGVGQGSGIRNSSYYCRRRRLPP